jgi:hypothetical protein
VVILKFQDALSDLRMFFNFFRMSFFLVQLNWEIHYPLMGQLALLQKVLSSRTFSLLGLNSDIATSSFAYAQCSGKFHSYHRQMAHFLVQLLNHHHSLIQLMSTCFSLLNCVLDFLSIYLSIKDFLQFLSVKKLRELFRNVLVSQHVHFYLALNLCGYLVCVGFLKLCK